MRFRFEASQEYQLDAIEAVAGIFDGQPRSTTDVSFSEHGGLAAVPNRLDLDEHKILQNLQSVQERNRIRPDDSLQVIEEGIETERGREQARFPNFSVEMETGTGKTYVYVRTVLELHKRYGLKKFIVVVPSVAVREGVLKTLQVTEDHLLRIYGGMPYRYYAYDSANLSQVRQFALSDSVEIMVMTIDSFNKASNVINQSTDRLQGETPIHLIQVAKPVLILDEPQNMESDLRVRALSALDPLFALRYSATHRNTYNLVYRLTPFDAYRQGLVKRIEVASVVKEGDASSAFLRLDSIRSQRSSLVARITAHKLMADGTIKEKTFSLKPGDSLVEKTERREYEGFEVDEINASGEYVRFANDVELSLGEANGADKEAIFDAQIRYAVEEHFRKQQRLRNAGIKVLSLFFIDRVDNYAPRDGIIRRSFVKAFDELKGKYSDWAAREADEVQAAYFASTRKKNGEVIYEDSKSGAAQKDIAAYELIMKNKERLLSFDEPVSFIFSHSALREGWDNPNVSQICTLNQSVSEIRKRQEVGRGVRLVVNQSGERVHEEWANVLTVVANESYERYVAQLQSEIELEYGREALPPTPPRAEKKTARLRKAYVLSPEFEELWKRIKHKTRYAVNIDTERLVADVVEELDTVRIESPRVSITRARVAVSVDSSETNEDEFEARRMSATRTAATISGHALPNFLDTVAYLMEHTTPPIRLTRLTLLEIYRRTTNKMAALENPHEFASVALRLIKTKMAEQLVEGIRYEKTGEWYEMSQFDEEILGWEQHMIPAARSIYDHVIFDSQIEENFVRRLEKWDIVKLYVKLPRWFTVPTPVGEYNPDWAIVLERRDSHGESIEKSFVYLVSETKGTKVLDNLRPDERRKIACGKAHFEGALEGLGYKLAVVPQDLL